MKKLLFLFIAFTLFSCHLRIGDASAVEEFDTKEYTIQVENADSTIDTLKFRMPVETTFCIGQSKGSYFLFGLYDEDQAYKLLATGAVKYKILSEGNFRSKNRVDN